MYIHNYEQPLMQYTEYRINKWILIIVPPILVVLGTFGNIFSFIILKRKPMLKFSTYFYLMVLAVADTLVLYIGLLRMWIGELIGSDIRDKADWICKLTNVLGYTVSDFSVWLIIAVTVERYIVVCHPLKANSFCNIPRARRVTILLSVCLFCINVHFFWTVELEYHQADGVTIPRCAGGPAHATLVEDVWPWVDAALYSFLPSMVIILLNCLIIRQVILAHRSRSSMQEGAYENRRPSHEGSTRLTIMLLTISFTFLLTTLPMNVINIVIAFNSSAISDLSTVAKFKLAMSVTQMLMYMNHSMNFFLYCATGQKFRHQLVWLMCYSKRTSSGSLWGSGDNSAGATRMDSVRVNNKVVSARWTPQNGGNCLLRSDMYSPLKTSTI